MSRKVTQRTDTSVPLSPNEMTVPCSQRGLEDFIEILAKSGAITRSSLEAATREKLSKFQIWSRKSSGKEKKVSKPSSKLNKPTAKEQKVGKKTLMRNARITAMQKIALAIGIVSNGLQWSFGTETDVETWNNAILQALGEDFFARDGVNGIFLTPNRKGKITAFLKEKAKLASAAEFSAALAIFPQYKLSGPEGPKTSDVDDIVGDNSDQDMDTVITVP
jgi:hypothetical protein